MRKGNRLLAGAITLAALASNASAAERAMSVEPHTVSCTLIRTPGQLQAIKNNLAATYCLANDIDLASIPNFVPIGELTKPFTGSFYGNNHVIRNLKINDTTHSAAGLFGLFSGPTLRDVSLVNVSVRGTGTFLGGLAGVASSSGTEPTIANVSVTGNINCAGATQRCGGMMGLLSQYVVTSSWSSADVRGMAFQAGGLVGDHSSGTIRDSFATGDVTCNLTGCQAGGLTGQTLGLIERSFATGTVTGKDSSIVGGLTGVHGGLIHQAFASGSVSVGPSSDIGGLIGFAGGNSITDQALSVGAVAATTGGLVGVLAGGSVVTNSYWDTLTGGPTVSAAGVGMTTPQLRAALPSGFDPAFWSISKKLSYPFINSAGLDFSAQLATVVSFRRLVTLLPISQLDPSQYRMKPAHADEASLATVYTMIARATGFASGVKQLQDQLLDVRIDRFFWHDARQMTTFAGPATTLVKPGALKPLGTSIAPIVDQLDAQRLVIVRGTFTNAKGTRGTHWMLATLYTKGPHGSASAIVANDPWTGRQVEIDPVTRKVISPANFPLKDFTVNAFQAVTITLPP